MTEEAIAKDFTGTTGVRREPEASLEGDDGAPPDAAAVKRAQAGSHEENDAKTPCCGFLAALFPATVLAQGATPSLPGAPQPTPSYPGGPRLPQGAAGCSGSYAIAASANEHSAYLWVVDNVQHTVSLCEKPEGREFGCTKKPLP